VRLRLPHPILLLLAGVAVAAILTWLLPAGEYDRREDSATGRTVVVAGTYHAVAAAPVGPFRAFVSIPRGFVEAADVVAVILLVGGAWVILDKLGALRRLVGAMVGRFHGRGLWAIPIVALLFAAAGAMENMLEEIIPLVAVLILLGRGLGVPPITMVAASAGAAMVGSAFGPTNPFQAGIALKLAQLPPLSGGWLRLGMFAVGLAVWIAWTLFHAARNRQPPEQLTDSAGGAATGRDVLMLVIVAAPMLAYVYGALRWGWGFNELSAGFVVAGVAVGLMGGLGLRGTVETYLAGMQSLLPAAMIVSVARSISVVLTDGKVIDTILHALTTPLDGIPAFATAVLMVPLHAVLHLAVPSVSGQAVLTMPVLVPLSDLLGISRQVTVLAYQTGAGLGEMFSPTNGALLAVLLAAGVPYGKWLRFAAGGILLCVVVGIAGMVLAT